MTGPVKRYRGAKKCNFRKQAEEEEKWARTGRKR
jgi:hypothetical protein